MIVDGTQYVSTENQCCIAVRYVIYSNVCEKMIALVDTSTDSTSHGLYDTLNLVFDNLGIPLNKYCIADAFDCVVS